ncbi:FTR1 family protein [Bacillus sp. 165]|uniref:FTR1 family iron permease n=1 Tax=Bacillus sp. 165 TaxID=1529117 RepID=UPI001ADBDF8F|nr:FTR1 family protein [Bacillus sp. 165]MBO9130565.1 FTR1 family protein [Bacillus sp. 165]
MQLQAFLITFREVLEALLVVGIITTYLQRTDNKKFVKYVYIGAGLAVAASYLVALLFQVVFTGFAAMGSEMYLKISIIFISAILLTQMVFWMAEHSKNIKSNVEGKMSHYITTGNIIGLVIHSFLVVVREGVETVFFFAAITGGNIGKALEGWGAISGCLVAFVVGYLFFKGSMRISLKTFFKVTGALIVLIAAGLFVQGIAMLQDLKILGSIIPHVYDITWLLPEHPIDYDHYLRDHGTAPLLSGDIGIFLKAFLGYSSMPSIEEVVAYLGYFIVVFLLVTGKKSPRKKETVSRKEAKVNNRVS